VIDVDVLEGEDAREGVDVGADDAEIFASLRAAEAPGELDADLHERILARALGPLAELGPLPKLGPAPREARALPALALAPEPSAAESKQADALRTRLGRGWSPDPEAEPDDAVEALVASAAAVRAAARPNPLADLAARRALAKAGLAGPKGGARRPILWGASVLVAAAAAFALVPRLAGEATDATVALVPARSTQALFDPAEPFPREGGASDRIDRIAASRRGDLRQNRFARWGIR
jgi:hypothetical protein